MRSTPAVVIASAAAERRRHPRNANPDDTRCNLRLRGGETLKLLNTSAGGALAESTRRLLPGHRYALQWTSGETVQVVRGEVVRARVGRLHGDSGLAYEVALLFDERVRHEPLADPSVNSLPTPGDAATASGAVSSPRNAWVRA